MDQVGLLTQWELHDYFLMDVLMDLQYLQKYFKPVTIIENRCTLLFNDRTERTDHGWALNIHGNKGPLSTVEESILKPVIKLNPLFRWG